MNQPFKCHLLRYSMLVKTHKGVVRKRIVQGKLTSANLKTCYSSKHSIRSRSFLGQRVVLFQTVLFSMVHWSKTDHSNKTVRARMKGHSRQSKLRISQALLRVVLNNLQESWVAFLKIYSN